MEKIKEESWEGESLEQYGGGIEERNNFSDYIIRTYYKDPRQ